MTPGIYPSVAPADYFRDPCPQASLTQSICKILLEQSPAHARLAHPRLCPPGEKAEEKYVAAQAIGNAAHLAINRRGRDVAEAPFDNWMTKEARAFRDEAIAAGKLPILMKHANCAREMVKAASYQLEAAGCRDAFRIGQGEVMIVAQERDLWLRSLVDWLCSLTRIWDYKTTGRCIHPQGIGAIAERDGWHIQAAFQECILDALDPENIGRRRFFFAVQENEPPYALVPVEMDEHWLTIGRKKVNHAVTQWALCMSTGKWPAYPSEIIVPQYPGWAEAKWLQQEMEREANPVGSRLLLDLAGG